MKPILCSRSFGKRSAEYRQLQGAICQFAARVAEKLRKEKQRITMNRVFIRTGPFEPKETYHSNTTITTLSQVSSGTRDILDAATRLLDVIWYDGLRYTRAGILHRNINKSDSLMRTLDRINSAGSGQETTGSRGVENPYSDRPCGETSHVFYDDLKNSIAPNYYLFGSRGLAPK